MSFKVLNIVRKNILNLKAYSSAREEFTGKAEILIDANENPFSSIYGSEFNRYPDPQQTKLKQKIASIKGIENNEIFIGNGSDEAIDLLFRIFCNPGKDNVILMPPTYGMYQVAANINDIKTIKVPLNQKFNIDTASVFKNINQYTKLIFVCSPNNPTGNLMDLSDIRKIAANFSGLIIIDEAYIDYSKTESSIQLLNNYKNIVVLQTFSKANGLAALRIGMAFANMQIIELLNKIKPPYNVNAYSQKIAIKTFENNKLRRLQIETTIKEREKLFVKLKSFHFIKKVYPSQSNFLLVECNDEEKIFEFLVENGIVTRKRIDVPGTGQIMRITVGSPPENQKLIQVLKTYQQKNKVPNTTLSEIDLVTDRFAYWHRKTKETDIQISLDLENNYESFIYTGINFFDHMLEQIAKHAEINLNILTIGDLETGAHHSIEDTAIVLGSLFKNALSDKKGIERYGFYLPMDESNASVLIDFGGRPHLVWKSKFKREYIGDMPTEMFVHFFKSFSDSASCNIHIKASGKNEHHKIEGIFKAFAKALKQAIHKNPNNTNFPSTKGLL